MTLIIIPRYHGNDNNRNMCLEANRATMEELFEFRQQMELSAMKAKTKRSEEYNTEASLCC